MKFFSSVFKNKPPKRRKLLSDDELEKKKKNNQFDREENLKDMLNFLYRQLFWFIPLLFLFLLILDFCRPSWVSNIVLLDKVVIAMGASMATLVYKKIHTL